VKIVQRVVKAIYVEVQIRIVYRTVVIPIVFIVNGEHSLIERWERCIIYIKLPQLSFHVPRARFGGAKVRMHRTKSGKVVSTGCFTLVHYSCVVEGQVVGKKGLGDCLCEKDKREIASFPRTIHFWYN
jgi:hypothetical protein